MLTPNEKSTLRENSPQRRIEPTTLRQAGQRAQFTTSELFWPPIPAGCRSGHDVRPRLVAFRQCECIPSPASLEDLIFCWLLLGPLSEFSVAGGLRPSDPKDSSKVGVDEWSDLQR